MAGQVTIQGNIITGPSGTKIIGPLLCSGVGNVMAVTDSPFPGAQSNTITPPVGATYAVCVPPSGNLTTLTLKGIAGDTGISLQPSQPWIVSFANPNAPASFVITSGGAVGGNGNVEITFF